MHEGDMKTKFECFHNFQNLSTYGVTKSVELKHTQNFLQHFDTGAKHPKTSE
jgi:hypothetical protein